MINLTGTQEAQVRAKLTKLLRLAEEGVGGEKVNAGRLLAKLLAQHNIGIDELREQDEALIVWYPYQNQREATLLAQIVRKVTNKVHLTIWSYPRKSKKGFELTLVQKFEVDMRWKAYRKAWKHQQDLLFNAFLSQNAIFAEETLRQSGSNGYTDEVLDAIRAMMAGMGVVQIHHALPSARKEARA